MVRFSLNESDLINCCLVSFWGFLSNIKIELVEIKIESVEIKIESRSFVAGFISSILFTILVSS